MTTRESAETQIQILLSCKTKPDIARQLYSYFCDEIKPHLVAKQSYNIVPNNSNNTVTLMFDSDPLSDEQLFTIIGILNQDKNI